MGFGEMLGILCMNHRAVYICGLGRSASLQILAIATGIAAFCAWQPIPIRSAHFPLDSCRESLGLWLGVADAGCVTPNSLFSRLPYGSNVRGPLSRAWAKVS